jgi:hypothetical protein
MALGIAESTSYLNRYRPASKADKQLLSAKLPSCNLIRSWRRLRILLERQHDRRPEPELLRLWRRVDPTVYTETDA